MFSEVKRSVADLQYLVMGETNIGMYEPMTFDIASGRFCWAYPSGDATDHSEAAEVYDRETAITLLGHHALNASGDFNVKLFPIYVQPVPKMYLIYGKHKDDEDDTPVPLCKGDYTPLTWARCFPDTDNPAPQIFDLETALQLIEAQTRYQDELEEDDFTGIVFTLYLMPVDSQINPTYNNPYLKPGCSVDGVVQAIKDSAAFCKEQCPDEEGEPWYLPQSLGGALVVPAVDELNHINSL